MSEESNQTNSAPDDLLADFTDRVLDGKTSAPASPPGSELHGLEETILRLKQTLPQEAPSEKTLRQIQASFKARVRKADSPTTPTWQFLRPRRPLALAFAVALAVLLLAIPFLQFANGPVQGTAGIQTPSMLLLAGIACVIVLLLLVRRHK